MTEHTRSLTGVFGARGVQGAAILQGVKDRGASVCGLSRRLPEATQDLSFIHADLGDRISLREAFNELTALSFTMPLVYDSQTTRQYAKNVAEIAEDAGIERVVVNSNTRIPEEFTNAPGFETRREAESIFLSSGVPVAIVRPTVYLENLLAPPIVEAVTTDGVLPYPVPATMPIAWVTVRDLGASIAALLMDREFTEGVFETGGYAVTGLELARQLGSALGKDVRFLSLDPADFEAGLATDLGSDSAHGIAGLYHWLNAHPESRLMAGESTLPARLDTEPTSITDWAAAEWPGSTPPEPRH